MNGRSSIKTCLSLFKAWILISLINTPLSAAEGTSIILQSTTSTQNSGLLESILPQFEKQTGIKVHVVAVGTGQALKNGENGDGDVLLVHAKSAEQQFVKNGYGLARHNVMYNDFVIIGPTKDPAKIKQFKDVLKALKAIAKAKATFISRGDDSGTHKKEGRLWQQSGITPTRKNSWYRESGAGMGATLNIAVGMGAYVLSDRATWIAFQNKKNLTILMEGDKRLFNQYGVILVNPKRHKNIKARAGQIFIDWLLGPKGQSAIANFKINQQQLFIPNAHIPPS